MPTIKIAVGILRTAPVSQYSIIIGTPKMKANERKKAAIKEKNSKERSSFIIRIMADKIRIPSL